MRSHYAGLYAGLTQATVLADLVPIGEQVAGTPAPCINPTSILPTVFVLPTTSIFLTSKMEWAWRVCLPEQVKLACFVFLAL